MRTVEPLLRITGTAAIIAPLRSSEVDLSEMIFIEWVIWPGR